MSFSAATARYHVYLFLSNTFQLFFFFFGLRSYGTGHPLHVLGLDSTQYCVSPVVLRSHCAHYHHYLFVYHRKKKHSPNTGARANNTLQATRPPHRGACWAECVRSAPVGTPRTACRVRGSGRQRRSGAHSYFSSFLWFAQPRY